MRITEEKFIEKVVLVPFHPCWEWTGSKTRGYGRLKIKGRKFSAHRVSYEIFKGPIPKDLVVMHSCNNKSCVRPDHLSVGTPIQNSRDARRDGLYKQYKFCVNGHGFTPENTVVYVSNGRWPSKSCRICRKDAEERRRKKREPYGD